MIMNDFDKEIFDICLDKLHKESMCNQEMRIRYEEKSKREAIYKEITKNVKFVSKFVKKCQSRQTGEKTVFYDIDIENMPVTGVWGEFNTQYNKYYRLLGRSLNLSMYSAIKRGEILNNSVRCYIIPAVKRAYEKYVEENFYGKEIEFEGEKCKAYQIDWFDEVYVAKEKIKTSFQKKIEEIEYKYRVRTDWEYPKQYEPESWERAWIDYVERYNIHDYFFNCQEMIKHPEIYSGIKDIDEYIREAEKILHRKIR